MKRGDIIVYMGENVTNDRSTFYLLKGMKCRFGSLTHSKKKCHVYPLENSTFVRGRLCHIKDILTMAEYRKFKIDSLIN